MIVTLPDLLDKPALEAVRQALTAAPWQDGKSSAQGKAREAKHNLVVPLEHSTSAAAGRIVLERLSQADFRLGLTVNPGGNASFAFPLMLRRTMVFGDRGLDAFKAALEVFKEIGAR